MEKLKYFIKDNNTFFVYLFFIIGFMIGFTPVLLIIIGIFEVLVRNKTNYVKPYINKEPSFLSVITLSLIVYVSIIYLVFLN